MRSRVTGKLASMHPHTLPTHSHKPFHGCTPIDGSAGGGINFCADAAANHGTSLATYKISVDAGAVIGTFFQNRKTPLGSHPGPLPGRDRGIDGCLLPHPQISTLLLKRDVNRNIVRGRSFQHAGDHFGRRLLRNQLSRFLLCFFVGHRRDFAILGEGGRCQQAGNKDNERYPKNNRMCAFGVTSHDPHGINESLSRSQRLSLRLVFPVFLFFCVIGVSGQGFAQRPVAVSPPPMAESTEVRVYRGQSVEIPLRAGGRVPGPLKFLIRSQPNQGTLGEPRVLDRNTAVITYSHDNKFPGGVDSFRFAVQAVDSPVSAPAEILVHVQEPPARLEAASNLNFGGVPTGTHPQKALSVANTGGRPATVSPTVSLPWSFEESGPKTINPGTVQKWTVVFSPTAPRDYSGEFRIPGHPAVVTALSGRGVELYSISPDGPIVLSNAKSRMISLRLQNRTDSPLTLQVTAPEGINISPVIQLPANAETPLEIAADPAVMTSISGLLVLETEGNRREIPVRSEAMPAVLVASPAAGFEITLGTSPQRVSKTLILKNQGGSPARMNVDSPSGVVIVPDPSSIIIPPGKSQTFEVSMEISGLAPIKSAPIAIHPAGGKSISLPLTYKKLATGPNVSTSVSPQPTLPASLPVFPDLKEAPIDPTNEIPAISEIRLISREPGQVEIAWNNPSPLAKSYLIEFRSLEFVGENSPPLSKWTKFPYARFQEKSGEVFATLSRLPADSSWFARVVSLDAQGKRSMPSEAVRIASPPHPPRPWLFLLAAGLFVLGAIGGISHFLMRARQSRKTNEAARISRLERE